MKLSKRRDHLSNRRLHLTNRTENRSTCSDHPAVPVLRVSFIKVLELLQPLRPTLELGDDLLSERQKNQLMQRFYEHMGRCITPQRRSRGCLRAVRQPVTGWPQIQHNDSVEGPLLFKLF